MTDMTHNPAAGDSAVLPHRVPWRAVIVFVILACGLAWAVALPLWLDGGLANPISGLLLTVITPFIRSTSSRQIDKPSPLPLAPRWPGLSTRA